MNPIVRKILVLITVTILVITAAGLTIGLIYGSKVKDFLLAEINKNLKTEIEVDQVQFSVFRNFPEASLEFLNVSAKEASNSEQKDELFRFGSLFLVFDLKDLFTGNYIIRKIILKNGLVNLRVDANGKPNYEFWIENEDQDSDNRVFKLDHVVFRNVNLIYNNRQMNALAELTLEEGSLKGRFSDKEFAMTSELNMRCEKIVSSDVNYIEGKEVRLEFDVEANAETGSYQIRKCMLGVAGLMLNTSGKIVSGEKQTDYDLIFESEEARLGDLLSMLPESLTAHFKQYTTRGMVKFNATYKGKLDANKTPMTEVNFSVRDGYMRPNKSPAALENLHFTGVYVSRPEKFEIRNLEASLDDHKLRGQFSIENFSNPYLKFNTSATFNLATLIHFLPLDTLEKVTGGLSLNASFAGLIKEVKNDQVISGRSRIIASGELILTKAGFRIKNNPNEFRDFNGRVVLQNNDVEVSGFEGQVSGSDFNLTGTCHNLLPFFLTSTQHTKIVAGLKSSVLELNELLTSTESTASDTMYRLGFSPRLSADLSVRVDDLRFRKFQAGNIKGRITLKDQVLSASPVSFNAMEGLVEIHGDIDASSGNRVIISCESKIKNLDIHKLFHQLENFGQETMVDKNLRGKATAEIQFASIWSPELNVDLDRVYAKADITIENGELIDFQPMMALSKFIKISELKHIRFSNLSNQIEIRNQTIFIPAMEIRSNALNLTASGTHNFDNIIDYKIKLLFSDLLGKKVKERSSEFGEIKDDGLGRMSLFLGMKGPAGDPKIYFDRAGVGQKIASEIKSEKQNLKQILKSEFGIFKKDTTLYEPREKEPVKGGIRIEREDEPGTEGDVIPGLKENNTQQKRKDAFRKTFGGSSP